MSQIKHKNLILAAIDQLRARKSRPDINRICKFMLKCYKVTPKDTKADLKRCLREKSIYKVDYKDNVSYRNAANWRTRSKANNKMTTLGTSERRIITSAIATLIYQDQSFLENGIAFEALVKAAQDQESKYSKKQLENIVNKELESGSLVKLSNGNLALGPADDDGNSSDSYKEYNADSNTKMTSSANSSTRSSPQRPTRGRPKKRPGDNYNKPSSVRSAGVRVGERRKMAKKVFDPSDNNMPSKRKRGRPVGSLGKNTIAQNKKRSNTTTKSEKDASGSDEQMSDASVDEAEIDEPIPPQETSGGGGVCSVCLVQKPRGSNDKLVECRDCSNKAHLSCLQSGSGILKPRPDNTWQCPHCKVCVVCCETNDAGILTVCSICSDAYHALCHAPRIPERLKAWDQWECNNCLDSQPTIVGSPAIGPSSLEFLQPSPTTPAEPTEPTEPTEPAEDPFLKPHELDRAPSKLPEDTPLDTSIPDITNWTTNDVYDYFKEHHPEAAPILRDQEFDGQAISMARREDIVRGLGLHLGPALLLYRTVVKLQTRKDDWTMCWG